MSDWRDDLARVLDGITERLIPALERFDASLTKAGQNMADEAEDWLRGRSE